MVRYMMYSANRKIKNSDGVLLHLDQGWHYQYMQYQQALKKVWYGQGVLRKGIGFDNAVMENFLVL